MRYRIRNELFKEDIYHCRLQCQVFEATPHKYKGHVSLKCLSNPNIVVDTPVHMEDLEEC